MRTNGPTSGFGADEVSVTIDLRDPSGDLAAVGVATPADLTPSERGVLEAVARGLSNDEIAAALGITRHTVKTHVRHVTDKLGAVNRTDAARMLLRARS